MSTEIHPARKALTSVKLVLEAGVAAMNLAIGMARLSGGNTEKQEEAKAMHENLVAVLKAGLEGPDDSLDKVAFEVQAMLIAMEVRSRGMSAPPPPDFPKGGIQARA